MAVIRKRKIIKDDTEIKDKTDEAKQDVEDEEKTKEENSETDESLKTKIFGYIKLAIQLLALLVLTPALVNFAALLREEKELKPEGLMVDVKNGQKLFKYCVGKGTPTVIFDAPLGETSDAWSAIIPAISKVTKVCTYDRAGLGYSDRVFMGVNDTIKSGKPHTVERMFEDFHKLFDNETKPFVLVGADLGATVIKFYTQMMRDSVASLVLINPYFNGLFMGEDNPWMKFWFYSILPTLQLKHMCSAAGLMRIGLQTGFIKEPYNYKNVPDKVKLRQKYLLCCPSHMSSIVEENYFLNVTLSQIRTLNKLRPLSTDIPLTLIFTDRFNGGISAERNQIWLKSQELATKTFGREYAEVIKIKGTISELLFNKHKKVEKLVVKTINEWKRNSKINSKY